MDNLTGGQLVARMLKNQGVDRIFTLSGLHVAGIYAGCVEAGIQVVDTRHEQAAAHAADAHARLTRGVGVAVVTAGPGVTDALTGVALSGKPGPVFLEIAWDLPEAPVSAGMVGYALYSPRA